MTATIPSPSIISACWTFDIVVTDPYYIYNGELYNGVIFSGISTKQPYVGVGRALSLTALLN